MSAFQFLVGQRLTADLLNSFVSTVSDISLVKLSDTARASTTTATADPELSVPVLANTNYRLHAILGYNGDTTGDMKGGLQGPSGATFLGSILTQGGAATTTTGSVVTDRQTFTTSFTFGCIGTGTNLTATITGVVQVGSTAGNVTFNWAQSVSSGTSTTVKAGSFITLTPLP